MLAGKLIAAWLVHLYTASQTVIAFLALLFIEERRFQEAFWLMFLAVVIDASDGTLARRARVKERIPWFDGERLENIIDYLNYVLVPCFFLLRADLLPQADAVWIAALPLLASAYGFCQKEAKTADHFFLGFPSYWNIVGFYFYVLQTPRWLNGFLILILSALVFVPIRYVYPSRTIALRPLTVCLGIAWAMLVALIIYRLPQPSTWIALSSLLFPIYYMFLSLWLEVSRQREEPSL